MDVTIRGRNVDVSDALRATATDKVARLSRHLDGWEHAEVHFAEEKNPRISAREVCEVTLRGHGHIIRAKAASPDMFASVDKVIDKLEHQIEKLKSRQQAKTHPRRGPVDSPDNDLPNESFDDEERTAGGARIVKSKRFEIKPMTPEEAALQMDMLGHGFYFFTNADTGVAAVVYRRGDGDVGLIDAD
ncbi:MAG: putative sigma-54 modulation protein [Actinomycetota bacterium]|jgi:putative sigma-54 modulation protein|nr:putative sigma-54 modulation protein [Actinomycetota bacterium]